MQLSQLEQPKEFELLFGIDVFYFNSSSTLNYTRVLVKYNDNKYE